MNILVACVLLLGVIQEIDSEALPPTTFDVSDMTWIFIQIFD